MSQPPAGLTPLDPAIRARRRRQNRVIIPLAVMILVPVLVAVGFSRYATSQTQAWLAHQNIPFNAPPTLVHVDGAGTWIVWTLLDRAECTVSLGGASVPLSPPTTGTVLEEAGFYNSGSFTAPGPGDYLVACTSALQTGYAIVSTPSPLGQITAGLFLVIGVGLIGFLTGGIMLILGLTRNSRERRPPAPPPWGPWPGRPATMGPVPPYAPGPPYPPGPPVRPPGAAPTRPPAPPSPRPY